MNPPLKERMSCEMIFSEQTKNQQNTESIQVHGERYNVEIIIEGQSKGKENMTLRKLT